MKFEPARSVVLIAEHTADPDTVRLDAGMRVGPDPGLDFEDPRTAGERSPLAARLLALEGVRRVRIVGDFVAVTKDSRSSWEDLGERIHETIRGYLESGAPVLVGACEELERREAAAAGEAGALAAIESILEREIRPAVGRDGGDVRLVAYRDGVLELELSGACAGCPGSLATLKLGIETRLRELIPGLREVVAAGS